jgi:Haem-binding domain
MRRRARWIVVVAALLLVGIQAVPLERTNPPGGASFTAPKPVADALQRSCFDCHSNHTAWPWYSRWAPVSWLVVHDVREGREKLNFSTWQDLAPARKARKRREAVEEIEKGSMPPWSYTLMHAEARLTPEEKAALKAWFASPEAGPAVEK